MPLSNITATASNGAQIISTAQTIAAGVTASATDEALLITVNNALACNNNTGAKVEISDCAVRIAQGVDFALSYGNSTQTASQVNITRSYVHWSLANVRTNLRITKLIGSTIRSTNTGAAGLAFVYTQAGNQAVLDGAIFDGIYVHEIAGAPQTFNNVTYRNCGINLLNWEAGDLTLTGVSLGAGTSAGSSYTGADGQTYNTYDAWIGNGNSANRLRFVDSAANIAKIAINLSVSAGQELCFKSYTRTERYIATGANIGDANVRFTPTASSGSSSQVAFDRTVNASGFLSSGGTEQRTAALLVQNTVDSGTTRSSGLTDPATIRNYTLKNITWSRRVRRADLLDSVVDVTPTAAVGSAAAPATAEFSRDTQFIGTLAQAAAITGVAFAVASGVVTVTATAALNGQEIYNAWKHWTSQFAQFGVSQSLVVINNGVLEITGSMAASEAISAGGNVTAIKATGAITTTGSGSFSLPIEDANGVRVTVRKSGGGNFNIAARYGSGSTYTDLGYQADVSTITYTVPKGQPVEVVVWALGYVTYSRLISTVNGGVVFDAEMTLNESINTSLDVSPYLPNIALSLDTSGASPVFVITFNAAMTIAGIELGKAVIHRLVGQEIALKAGFPPGSAATIVINSDEITNQLPAARLALGAGLSVTDRVYLDFFINTAPALAINPAYVINPPRADGNQVVILRAKPALDASVMALAVRQEIERTGGMLDGKASQASVTALATANQTEHDATQAAIAALPAPLTATQTRAQVDAALTAYDAVVPADLATLATAAQVTALGAPLQASSYTAPPSATSTAQAVRAELATELGRMDASVSSRLASASYTAPTAPPTAAQNATAVRTELATELGRIDASVSSRLAASAYTAPTTPPTAAAIRAEIETAGGKLDKAMKAAQAAEDQTL